MNSLIIDTSSIQSCVGVAIGNDVILERYHLGSVAHAEVVPIFVAEALAKVSKIDQVIVGMGPGSYVGLRVGIAFARAFALGREIGLIGVCSLDGIEAAQSDYLVTTDARRNEIFWARYKAGKRVDGPHVSTAAEIMALPEEKFGLAGGEPLYPIVPKLLAAGRFGNIAEPIYLREPDVKSPGKSK